MYKRKGLAMHHVSSIKLCLVIIFKMADIRPYFYKKLILLTKRPGCCKYHRKLLTVVFEHYIWIHLPIFLKILISIVEYVRFKVSCLFCVPATGKLCTDAHVCLYHTIVYIILQRRFDRKYSHEL